MLPITISNYYYKITYTNGGTVIYIRRAVTWSLGLLHLGSELSLYEMEETTDPLIVVRIDRVTHSDYYQYINA